VVRVRSGERLPSRRSPFQRPQHWHVPFGTSGRGPVGPFGLRLWWLPALSRDLAHQAPARLRAAPPARQSGPRHSRDTSASLAGAGSCRATAPGCASTRPWRWKPPTRAGPAGESTRGRRPRRLAGVGDRPGAGRPDQDAGADRPDQGRSVRAGAGGLRTAAHPARSWANWSKCWPSTWRHPRGRTLLGRTPRPCPTRRSGGRPRPGGAGRQPDWPVWPRPDETAAPLHPTARCSGSGRFDPGTEATEALRCDHQHVARRRLVHWWELRPWPDIGLGQALE
jgi:hypothetical protein